MEIDADTAAAIRAAADQERAAYARLAGLVTEAHRFGVSLRSLAALTGRDLEELERLLGHARVTRM